MDLYTTNFGTYQLEPDWGLVPGMLEAGTIAGVGCSPDNNIYVLTRQQPAILIYQPNGTCLRAWDDAVFVRPHGIHISASGHIFVVDDANHAAYQFDNALSLRKIYGTPGLPSDTGCVGKDYRTIIQSAGPFNYPTDVDEDGLGRLYFSDGYGNARVHRFSSDGKLQLSWGEPGIQAGQFQLPHNILCHNSLIYVADRQNNRVQVFDLDGNLKSIFTGLFHPAGLCIGPDGFLYVAECVHRAHFDHTPSRISVFSLDGKLIGRLGNSENAPAPPYATAHSLTIDCNGNLYIGEVGKGFPSDYLGLIKLRRIS